MVLGIGIPIVIIYLNNLLRFKIESRADVEKITDVPVVGDVPMADTKGNPIVVHENHNDLMEEVFRSVRTNIQYMLQEGQKSNSLHFHQFRRGKELYRRKFGL